MKKLFFSLAVLAMTSSAFASSVIKTCNTTLESEDKKIPATIEILTKGNKFSFKMTQNIEGHSVVFKGEALVSEHIVDTEKIQIDMATEEIDSANLNSAENYLAHAFTVTTDPVLKDVMSTGMDLLKVKEAKVFELVGDEGDMFRLAIIEGRDSNGKNIGSFFGGFLVSPCK